MTEFLQDCEQLAAWILGTGLCLAVFGVALTFACRFLGAFYQ